MNLRRDERAGEWIATSDHVEALKLLAGTAPGGHLARVPKLKVKMSPPEFTKVEVAVGDEAGTVHALAAAS